MTITPYGAAGEVTGSNWLVDSGSVKILVDCGAFQGEHEANDQNHAPFRYDPRTIQALALTHAHLDHCGRLPSLVKAGFAGPIYCTPATRDLAEIELRDAAAIALHDQQSAIRRGQPNEPRGLGYTQDDVERCLQQFRAVEYNVPTTIEGGATLELIDAGHILGAASVRLTLPGQSNNGQFPMANSQRNPNAPMSNVQTIPQSGTPPLETGNWPLKISEKTQIVFSGDIGNPGSAIVRDPQHFADADVVVMEATYGNREHRDEADPLAHFIQLVEQAVMRGGVVLIPAFSIERTQELLYAFFEWQKDAKLNHIPVFLDGPMAIRATEVFRRYPQYFDAEAAAIRNAGHDFFRFPMLKTTLTPESSKAIAHIPAPKIIIAGSGMLTGGRILYHLRDHLAEPTTTVIFTGYQAVGTLGRRIQNGERSVMVKHERIPVRAQIESLDSLSAHADRSALLQWLEATHGLKQLIIGHADEDSRVSFAKLVKDKTGLTAQLPQFGESIEVG